MLLQTATAAILEETINALVADLLAALPAVLGGIVFLVLASLAVLVLTWLVRVGLRRAMPTAEPAYRQFFVRVVALFLWFGVALAFISIIGMPEIAAALGTASGFLALGVAYALSGMLADAVAGIYLLRDPDFNPGDEVEVGDMTGVVDTIELRKTRFEVEADTVVRANADIEKRWTKRGSPAD